MNPYLRSTDVIDSASPIVREAGRRVGQGPVRLGRSGKGVLRMGARPYCTQRRLPGERHDVPRL